MRSHQFRLSIPSTRFQKVADKILSSAVQATHRGHFVDLAIKFDGENEDLTMQEAMDIIKTARGAGRHGCLRDRMTFVDDHGQVVGIQQSITFG